MKGLLATYYSIFILALILFTYCFYQSAWIVDEAYVTYRTIEHFIHGNGLRFNLDERVQGYTNPLWLFSIIPLRLLSGEYFYTTLLWSYLLCTIAFIIFFCSLEKREKILAILSIIFCCSSKAIIDFSSSGLEYPLLYLLVTLFFVLFLSPSSAIKNLERLRTPTLFALLGSLLFATRMDAVILCIPASFYVLTKEYHLIRQSPVKLALATLPATGWILFSLFYYGFIFPNTAYAKLFCSGIELETKINIGLLYLEKSFSIQWPLYLFAAYALGSSLFQKNYRLFTTLLGALCYLGYIALSSATSTHMIGKLTSLPLFVIAIFGPIVLTKWGSRLTLLVALLCWNVYSSSVPVKAATKFYTNPIPQHDVFLDTRRIVEYEGPVLVKWRRGNPLLQHKWYKEGMRSRHSEEKVIIRGDIGYFPYAVGLNKHVINSYGLTDPLLARIQLPRENHRTLSGHYLRHIPHRYTETIAEKSNIVEPASLKEFYEHLFIATRGPLFSLKRLKSIFIIQKDYPRCYIPPELRAKSATE